MLSYRAQIQPPVSVLVHPIFQVEDVEIS
jgi:hypothetical protein